MPLEDVADLVRDHQPMIGDAVINQGDGLMLIVEKLPWANTMDVTRGVEQALDEMRPGLQGIEIDSAIFRPATFIEDSISNLTRALLLGALLMIMMLGAFLYSWRTALISVVAIPLSLLAALLVLNLRDTTINTMILAGFVIALGDIVDDAIIDIENVVRRFASTAARAGHDHCPRDPGRVDGGARSHRVRDDHRDRRRGPDLPARRAVRRVLPAARAGLRPRAAGIDGGRLTVTPALSLILFQSDKSLEHRESPLVPPLKRAYTRVLRGVVMRPRAAYGAVAVTTVSGLVLLPLLGQSLLPSFKERDFLMHWLTPPDTSLQEEVRTTKLVNAELLEIPGVRNAGSTSATRCWATNPTVSTSARTGSASTSRSTTTPPGTASRTSSTVTRASTATC